MSSGNHMANQADKEREKKGECPECHRLLKIVDWCTENGYVCSLRCEHNIPNMPCYQAEEKLYCEHCSLSFPID